MAMDEQPVTGEQAREAADAELAEHEKELERDEGEETEAPSPPPGRALGGGAARGGSPGGGAAAS